MPDAVLGSWLQEKVQHAACHACRRRYAFAWESAPDWALCTSPANGAHAQNNTAMSVLRA
eukprot:156289-Alexandrium_andersonii.AAC.1